MAGAPDSIYHFKFPSPTGDAYYGLFVADTGVAEKGTKFWSPEGARTGTPQNYGYYEVLEKKDMGYDLADRHGSQFNEGTTWVYKYYDKDTNAEYTPNKWANGEQPAGTLGQEYDHINLASRSVQGHPVQPAWDDFGMGGKFLAGGNNQGPGARQNPTQTPTQKGALSAEAADAATESMYGSDHLMSQHSDYLLG